MSFFRQFIGLGLLFILWSCSYNESENQEQWITESPYDLVNPFIGTGGHGHTFPGATMPFGMVQLSPDTRLDGWDGCSGYHFTDTLIYGFSHTHLSGTGVSDYGDILLTPHSYGNLISEEEAKEYRYTTSSFDKSSEKANPGFYSVYLKDQKVAVKLSSTERVGIHSYKFEGDKSKMLLNLNHRDRLIASEIKVEGKKKISGFRHSRAWAENQRLFFTMEFSKPFEHQFIDEGDSLFVQLDFADEEDVMVKVALSSTSVEGAELNLAQEASSWEFDYYLKQSKQKWSKALNKIRVSGKDRDKQVIFYTALYHTMIAPNLLSDVDGTYRGMDGETHQNPKDATYTIFSLWDTFRATHPLYTMIEREKTASFIRTFLNQYQQGEKLPVWELAANETNCMIGYHSVSVITDAYRKGINDFDTDLALEAMIHSAKMDEHGLKSYKGKGYISAGDEAESVSKTLEYAYDDWCIAQFAAMVNEPAVEEEFLKRSLNYRNLFDPETKFLRARMNGDWFKPFDPFEVNFNYTEANAWQYSLFAPHDISGLIHLFGGESSFEAHLDKMFKAENSTTGREQADITGLIGQYAHGNEPSHHMAYLYSYIGKPWKTQEKVSQIMREQYQNAPDGLSGNEDCGQMSAWYVMSAMGFYPVTPGLDYYTVGTPIFDSIQINFEDGRSLQIVANGLDSNNIYIQSSTLNGKECNSSFVGHKTLMKGGELKFNMTSSPSTSSGLKKSEFPISKTTSKGFVPAPFVVSEGMTFTDSLKIEINSIGDYPIWYAVNKTAYKKYESPFYINADTHLSLYALNTEAGAKSAPLNLNYKKIKKGRSIELKSEYANQYAAAGQNALIDQLKGNNNFRTGFWQGYQGQDVEAIVNLGKETQFKSISVGFLQDIRSWIWYPKELDFYISNDGENFEKVGTKTNEFPRNKEGSFIQDLRYTGSQSAQYVKIIARNPGDCPDWHLGAGGKSWIFIDEISIE